MDGNLTAREKAAILLICLGENYAAQVYKFLSEDEIEQLTLALSGVHRVTSKQKEVVVQEFYEICLAQEFISEGGIGYARSILEKAYGSNRAEELIGRLSSSLQVRPFEFIRKADSMHILNLVYNENPQIIALLLSYIEPKQASEVISNLPQDVQVEVIYRIANMGSVQPEYIQEAERILERRLASLGTTDKTVAGGINSVVQIINSIDRGTEKFIMESLDARDGELAEEIRKCLFVFEDIAKLSNQAIQRVLKEIENSDLTVALKGATEEVKKAIFSNVSKRLQEMIADDLEVMGPVRVRDVEAAQQKIVNVIRQLEDSGEIIVSRGEGDDLIV
ncbi:flagellar motor switch protein FliG [Papillibacter cinnamivorans]|uniref:Flagellar motor switch protein FliG n=1 Tax=Papillibacter cinnamivorans DSM 12816 TaxID=1122930 RepID=A0A1W1YH96_9FIRM|nr:flagellar motor switch protein FliG [Papillibacter cinnamivorans]SMC35600.1 flagellar motor switch protein FliG [Papillibacter cinnamivorans DSM 12816]